MRPPYDAPPNHGPTQPPPSRHLTSACGPPTGVPPMSFDRRDWRKLVPPRLRTCRGPVISDFGLVVASAVVVCRFPVGSWWPVTNAGSRLSGTPVGWPSSLVSGSAELGSLPGKAGFGILVGDLQPCACCRSLVPQAVIKVTRVRTQDVEGALNAGGE